MQHPVSKSWTDRSTARVESATQASSAMNVMTDTTAIRLPLAVSLACVITTLI